MVSTQLESFTFLAAVTAFFLSTVTGPAMSEGECNFDSNVDVLELVHNNASRGKDPRWVRDGMYPGLLCRIRSSDGIESLSNAIFYKNDVRLEASSRINGSTLTFPTFTADDQGQYQCGCSSTVQRSNKIILLVTPPKSELPPPSFVVKYGSDVTINCPLTFITFGDLPQFYKVDWQNSEGANLVEESIVVSPMVSFDNRTLQLTILNVMSDEEYRCVITRFDETRFSDHDTMPSDPVRIHALDHQRVSVELQPPIIASGETTTINCSQTNPSYNPLYRLELAEDGSIETKVYHTSVYNYTAKSVSVNVRCTVIQHSNATTPQEMVYDTNTQRIIVVGTIQLNGNNLRFQDDIDCIQVLRVEYTSTPTTMELMYTVTPDQYEPCPPTSQSRYRSTSVSADGNLHVNLMGVTYDGTTVDLYVRAWLRHNGVNGKCSNAVRLGKADETCYGVIPISHIVDIAVVAVAVGIIIIPTPVACCILFCRWLRKRDSVDFHLNQEDSIERRRRRHQENPKDKMYKRKRGPLKKRAATNTNAIKDRTKEDPRVVGGEIEMTPSPAYEIVSLSTSLDKPIQAESRLYDRQSDTPPLVHNEVEMSEVMMTQTRTGTTAVTTSLESHLSIYNNQSTEYQLDTVEDCVIPKMADKWKEFGIRLGIQDAVLDSIYKSNFGNTVDCCRGVLYHWISSNGGEVSWDKVIQVMKDCERKLQASELEDHLSGKGTTAVTTSLESHLSIYNNQSTATNTNAIRDRTKEDPREVGGEIEMTSIPAYEIVKLTTPLDKPIQAESRLYDRQSDTPPLVHSEFEMSEVMITQTRTGTTVATTSLEPCSSIYNNQSIGQCKTLSRTATQQPSSTVSRDSSGLTRVTSDKWWVLGEARTIVVTSCGGEWSLSPFSGKRGGETSCAVLTAPSGVVKEGTVLPVEYCVILDGPFALPSNYVRVSVAIYLNCDESLLRKPLEVKLCHWAAPVEDNNSHFSERLSFLKAPHKVVEGQDSHHFKQIEGAEFHTSTSTGILSLKNHFCLICIACERSGPHGERVNKRCYAMLWEGEEEDRIQQFRIVIMYAVPSWKQATREHYLSEKKGRFKYSEVRDFVFTKDCQLHLGIAEDKGNDWVLQQIKTMLYQEDLLLSKFAEKECKEKIDEVESGLYPPAMIFDVGYELPPSKESRIKFLMASLHGVKNEINFSFPVLENLKMCSCSTEQREFYGKRKKRKVGSDISKKYQLDPVTLENFVIPKMADKWREFGIRLEIQNAMLDSIFKSNFGNTLDCCRGVLYHWMSSNSDEVSWDKVIQVMKDCERIQQASELENHLSGKDKTEDCTR